MKSIIRWIGLCAMAFAGYPSWSQAPKPTAAPLSQAHLTTPILLAAQPTHRALTDAKSALSQGGIVKMENESVADFNAWLGTAMPSMEPAESAAMTERPSGGRRHKNEPPAKILAAHYAADGSLHSFQCNVASKSGDRANRIDPCATSFTDWSNAELGGVATYEIPGPEVLDWTAMGQITSVYIDDSGNQVENRIRPYRLNDLDSNYDWYMVLRDPVSTPKYSGCQPLAGACGWWTDKRDFQFALSPEVAGKPGFLLYDWSPKQDIGKEQGQLSLGLSL